MAIDFDELLAEQSRLNKDNSDWKKRYVNMPEKEGSVIVRLLPPAPGKKWFYGTRYHKIGGKNFYSHLEYVKGKWEGTCPINAEIRRLWAEIDKAEKAGRMDLGQEYRNIYSQIRPIEKYHYACIVRNEMVDGKVVPNSGPKVYSANKEVHSKIINYVMGQMALNIKGLGDVSAFDKDKKGVFTGRDLQIIKRLRPGKDAFPEYSQSMFLEPSVAGTTEEWERWMANLPDLEAERRIKPVAEVQEALDVFFGRKTDSATQVPAVKPFAESKPTPRPVVSQVISSEDDLPPDDDFIAALRNV